jgi:predicted permease
MGTFFALFSEIFSVPARWGRRWLAARRNSREALDEELRFHIDEAVAAKVDAGMDAREARRAVMAEFGAMEARREEAYRLRPGWLAETMGQDVRYALRGFRRNPGFTAMVIATLALAIGATTAVLSVVDPILFRPLPYTEGERLVSVGLTAPIIPEEFMLGGSYYVWRDNQQAFSAFTSESGVETCNLTERNPAHLGCAWVEGNFLKTLGVRPALGRDFLPEEDRPNGPDVAILSWSFWRSHFGGSAAVLDRLIDIDGRQTRVIGVLPAGFVMPAGEKAEIMLPQALDEAKQRKADPGRVLSAFGRLRPGVNVDAARRSLEPLFQYSLQLAPPAFRKEVHLRVRSVRERQKEGLERPAWVLLAAVLAVLLTACANVASLLLARGVAREREMAVRSALGGTRARLVAQMLIESLLQALAGAAAGWIVAWGLVRVFTAIAPAGLPMRGGSDLSQAHLDLRIAGFTIALAIVCGLVCGLFTAQGRPRALARSLAVRGAEPGAAAWIRRGLVVAQIAISVVLLSASSLLVKSFWNLRSAPLGLSTRGVMAVTLDLVKERYATPASQMDYFLRVEAALRRLPGVTAVGVSDSLPPSGAHHESILNVMQVEGQARSTNGTGGMVAWRSVTPDYFRALDLHVVAGRAFSEEDRGAGQAAAGDGLIVVSRLLAKRLFAGRDPIGARVRPSPAEPYFRVVGVAEDVKNAGLAGGDEPEYYRLRRNGLNAAGWGGPQVFTVASTVSAAVLAPWIRAEIAGIDPAVPLEITPLGDSVKALTAEPRFEAALLGFFACCGLLMAMLGLYGVMAFLVSSRRREIGVRLALGASRGAVLRRMIGEGGRMIGVGGAVGIAAALGAGQLLRGLLYGVSGRDPAVLMAVVGMLTVVALAATLVPARRAMRVHPMEALREE